MLWGFWHVWGGENECLGMELDVEVLKKMVVVLLAWSFGV